MSLRSKLVRLAYERPELRSHLLPIFQEEDTRIKMAAKGTSVLFAQAVLESPEKFKAWVQSQKGVPSMTGWDFKSHHMTLEFFDKNAKKALKSAGEPQANILKPYAGLIGNSYVVDVVGIACDDKACAVLIKSELPCTNKFPHITVAVNGVPPKYSNELLEGGEIIPCRGKFRVKVGFHDGRGDRFELPEDYTA